jgi:hypothetical protein
MISPLCVRYQPSTREPIAICDSPSKIRVPTSACSYFILRALAAAGDIDRGVAVVHACWDVMIDLDATTSWETSKPGWSQLLKATDGVPAFQVLVDFQFFSRRKIT